MLRKFKVKDNKYRHLFQNKELKALTLKFIERQGNLSMDLKKNIFFVFKKWMVKSLNSHVRTRNGCVVTGRSRFVLRRARLSRMQLKNLATKGFLVGARKSSW